MGIVSEMKKKIAERGGTIPEGHGVADAFKSYDAAIGEGGGGSSLPSVTSADNGDVLTVVDGAWAKAAPSGGSDLPAVTESDNGDVLTVVDGAWGKATPSGGIFPVNLVTGEDENRYTDKTWNEIKASYDNGLLPVLVIDRSADLIADIPTAENVDCHEVAAVYYMETYSIDDEPRYKVDFYNGNNYTLQSTNADGPMMEM